MNNTLNAALTYFGLIFALGFGLGMVRELAWAPHHPRLGFLVLEVPMLVAASWAACRWVLRRFRVPPALRQRAVMGAAAFALLLGAEWGLATLTGQTPAEFVGRWGSAEGALGLLGQTLYGLMPLWVLRPADG